MAPSPDTGPGAAGGGPSSGPAPAAASSGNPAPSWALSAIPAASGGKDRSLIAVVWCRQVDNEAESPGYTTVPTEFPGRKETLDMVRIVGNLAINAADTHDYWDPDPSSKLAYYHNLFLYPANGGAHLCLGRMFLSTEDRPRLGMKTLVLDVNALLESENVGQALRRWYLSMGNPGKPSPSEGRVDPVLLDILSDGLTFLRADPDAPLFALVSDHFHDAVGSVLAALERSPSSLAILVGVLIFPYFLPAGRVDLAELTETFPLSLGIARIPRNEAGGERHQRRVAAWAQQNVHLLDLTQGIPAELSFRPPARAPVSWWARGDRADLVSELRREVDRLEVPRRSSPEPGGWGEEGTGLARRRQLARLSRAMSAVAQVLELPEAERSKADPATLELAEPYLAAAARSGLASSGPAAAKALTAGPASTPLHAEPPWRRPPRLRSERSEVVPVPRDTRGGGLPPGDARGAGSPPAPVAGSGSLPAPQGVGPAAPPVAASAREASPVAAALPLTAAGGPPYAEPTPLSPALLEELRAYIDSHIGEGRTRSGALDPDVVGDLERELERRLEARARLLISPEALEARITQVLARRPPPSPPEPRLLWTGEARDALTEVVNELVAQKLTELAPRSVPKAAPPAFDPTKVDERLVALLRGEVDDTRVSAALGQRIQSMLSKAAETDRKSTDDRLEQMLEELHTRSMAQAELEASIHSEVRFLDEKLQTLMGRLIPLLRRTWLKIDELERRPSGGAGPSERKLKQLRDELWGEMRRLELDLSERTRLILDRVEGNVQNQGRLWLTLVSQLSSLTEQRRELERIVHESKEDFEPPEPARSASSPTRPGTGAGDATGASSDEETEGTSPVQVVEDAEEAPEEVKVPVDRREKGGAKAPSSADARPAPRPRGTPRSSS